MLTWLLYLCGLIAAVAVLTLVFGKAFGRGEIMPPLADTRSVQELNAEAVKRGDIDMIRFDTVIRGYRQDQVDAVIDALVAEISELKRTERPVNP